MNCSRFRRVSLDRVPFEDKRRWLAMWERARGAQALPVWGRDLTFADIEPPDVPRMVLAEMAAEPAASAYRFWGTALKRSFGDEMMGRRVRDLSDPDLAEAAAEQYAVVVAAASPCFFVARLHAHRVGENFEGMLRLPFGADSAHVDTVLSLQFAEGDGFAVRPLWDGGVDEPVERYAAG